jgi:hypothetical protein
LQAGSNFFGNGFSRIGRHLRFTIPDLWANGEFKSLHGLNSAGILASA